MIGKSKWSVGALITAFASVTFCLALLGPPTVAYSQPAWAARDRAAEDKDTKTAKDHYAKVDSRNSASREKVREPAQGWQRGPAQVQERSRNSSRSDRGLATSSEPNATWGRTSSSVRRSGWGSGNRDSRISSERQSGWTRSDPAPSASNDRNSSWGRATQSERRSGWGSGNRDSRISSERQSGWTRSNPAPSASNDRNSSWGRATRSERRSGWGSGDSKTTLPSGRQPGWDRGDRMPTANTERRSGWGTDNRHSAGTDRTPVDSESGWTGRQRTDTTGATSWRGTIARRNPQSPKTMDREARLPKATAATTRQRTITVETGWKGRVHTQVRRVPYPPSGWSAARRSEFSVAVDIRHHNTSLWLGFSSYRRNWGDPGYLYQYRPYGEYGHSVSIHYYYPCYYYRPGPIFFDPYRPYYDYYYPAPFCTYGWFSFWLPASVVIIERPVVVTDNYWSDDSGYYTDYYSVPDSARDAMGDIRDAWLDNHPELIQDHLQQYGKIRIYFQGRYAYSISGEDYYQMVQDAFSTLQTERFGLARMRARSGDEVFVSAQHEFVDPDGHRHTVQLRYTLHRSGGTWYITAVDSSSRYLEIRGN